MVITISGPHGTGKTTYAKKIAKALNLRHVSAGELFRKIAYERNLGVEELSEIAMQSPEIDKLIDERTKKEAECGNVIIDGQLAGWMTLEKATLKIFLVAPKEIRIKRVSERDRTSIEETEKRTFLREELERERYKRYYGIDLNDVSIYDVIVDTSLMDIDGTTDFLISVIKKFMEKEKIIK
ncbi:AAA family ATPase [Candidatus Bathyarchaeota archaeon]|nr:AAA family ATPase [Candidatus Bathyarchaeota archaeon]